MKDLKLIALDAEDLSVVSAHLQDAVIRVGDLVYERGPKRFACVLNRFDWLAANENRKLIKGYQRLRTGLRFERVLSVRSTNIDRSKPDVILSLLALSFKKGDAPGGHVTLLFSGGGTIELEVECIEAELRDLGAAWSTHAKPTHRDHGSDWSR